MCLNIIDTVRLNDTYVTKYNRVGNSCKVTLKLELPTIQKKIDSVFYLKILML